MCCFLKAVVPKSLAFTLLIFSCQAKGEGKYSQCKMKLKAEVYKHRASRVNGIL